MGVHTQTHLPPDPSDRGVPYIGDHVQVQCDGTLKSTITVFSSLREGMSMCEISVYGRYYSSDWHWSVLAGKAKIYPKYSPEGFRGFLHFLYDVAVRVWSKTKQRFGVNQLWDMPFEGNYEYTHTPKQP